MSNRDVKVAVSHTAPMRRLHGCSSGNYIKSVNVCIAIGINCIKPVSSLFITLFVKLVSKWSYLRSRCTDYTGRNGLSWVLSVAGRVGLEPLITLATRTFSAGWPWLVRVLLFSYDECDIVAKQIIHDTVILRNTLMSLYLSPICSPNFKEPFGRSLRMLRF